MKKQNIMMTVLAVLILAVGVPAQSEVVELGDGAKLVPQTFAEENKERLFDISAEYPELQGVNSAAAAKFNQLVKSVVMKDVEEFRQAMLAMDEEELKFARDRGINNYVEIHYGVATANSGLISLTFGNGSYMGGAHPNSYSYSINFDLKNGRQLELSDLFVPGSDYLKVISDYSITDLNKQLETDGDDEWIARGAGPDAENFKSWTLGEDGLRIDFDAYQVGPYVIGPQDVLIPFSELKSVLRPLDFEPIRYVADGNPVNWCRNGLFPKDGENFRLATVTGRRNEKIFFYRDDDRDCPNSADCKTRSYVIPGDEVIVSRTYGDYACSWYQPKNGDETVGWIALGKLDLAGSESTRPLPWIGEWMFAGNTIKISPMRMADKVSIKGNAFWQGLGDNIHIGEIDFSGIPDNNRLSLGEGDGEYDCRVKMQRLGRFLIVSDNLNCGGMNVTFNGIYQIKTN